MRWRGGVAAGLVAALSAPPVVAAAPPTRVLVLPRREGDPLPVATDASLREGIREGLRRSGFGIVEATGTGVTRECGSDCAGRLRALGVRYLVRPTLAAVDRDYTLRLELVDVQTGVSVATFDERCSLCGLTEARERAAAGAADLGARLARGSEAAVEGRVSVTSERPGAQVSIDGVGVGPTPLERGAEPGEHELVVSPAEGVPLTRRFSVTAGEKASFILLAPREQEGPPRSRGRVLLGLGVPLTILGLTLAAFDEAPIPLGCEARESCEYRLDVTWPAVLSVAAGAALTAAGAVLVHQARRRARRPR